MSKELLIDEKSARIIQMRKQQHDLIVIIEVPEQCEQAADRARVLASFAAHVEFPCIQRDFVRITRSAANKWHAGRKQSSKFQIHLN